MKELTEYLLNEDGTLSRRKIIEENIEVSEAVINAMNKGVFLRTRNTFVIPEVGPVHLTVADFVYATIPLNRIPLKAPYSFIDGVLMPSFSSEKEPVMPMKWITPDSMRLVMLVMLAAGTIKDQWLIAYDGSDRAYRLPLGNLYDDAKLCNGEMTKTHASTFDAVKAELEQFEKGQWNGDLNNQAEQTKKLFRFKPLNDTFEQLPPLADWTELSIKVAPTILKYVIL